jgi:toxin ParE1/3/4
MGRENRDFRPPLRIYPTGSHIVVYEIVEHDDILILRVRHHRADWTDDPIGDLP